MDWTGLVVDWTGSGLGCSTYWVSVRRQGRPHLSVAMYGFQGSLDGILRTLRLGVNAVKAARSRTSPLTASVAVTSLFASMPVAIEGTRASAMLMMICFVVTSHTVRKQHHCGDDVGGLTMLVVY